MMSIFYCYAHEDERLRNTLAVHLSLLRRQGYITEWHDRCISPGKDWAAEIDRHLMNASVILLLVSPDFLASDYIYSIEMKRALERHRTGKVRVIPIILRPVDWFDAPFAYLSALPRDGKPITTWSNQDEAFLEVAVGIRETVKELRARPDIQPPPNPAPLPVPTPFGAPFPEVWNVPRRHNAFFTGRASALEHLAKNFQVVNEAGMISPQVITGLGGMGKTQVAAEYAYRWRGNYQTVLWVRAETQESLLTDFRTIADLLKLPQERWRDQDGLLQSMQEWFRTWSDWLLIFDNADNLALLEPFLPQAARGHFLATTRAGAVISLAQNPLILKTLGADDGALCLLRRAGLLTEQQQLSAAHPADVDDARQLAQIMEGLPLALEQAGAYINDTECSVRGYRKLYDEFRKDIQPVPFGVLRDYPETVVSVWHVSRSAVKQSNPAAAELLCLCAFLAPDGIPDEMVIAGANALGPVLKPVAANRSKLNMSISVLRKYSLLNRDVDREMDLTRLSIHRIMQNVIIDEMDKRTQRLWAERSVRVVELAARSMTWQVLQSQARHCQRLIEQWHMTFSEAKRLLQWIEKNERLEKR